MSSEVSVTLPGSNRESVSTRLEATIRELRHLQKVLLSEELDARILNDFRDALNRTRNTAWAAQQSLAARLSESPQSDVHSLLASERIRAAYQLCRAIQADLADDDIQYQKGQLAELTRITAELRAQLTERLEPRN